MWTGLPQVEGVRSPGQNPPSHLLNRERQGLRYACCSSQVSAWCASIMTACVTAFKSTAHASALIKFITPLAVLDVGCTRSPAVVMIHGCHELSVSL